MSVLRGRIPLWVLQPRADRQEMIKPEYQNDVNRLQYEIGKETHWKFYHNWVDVEKEKRRRLMKQSLRLIGDHRELIEARILLSSQLISWLKAQEQKYHVITGDIK